MAELQLIDSPRFIFASLEQARAILSTRDEFIRCLSPFDRAARIRTKALASEGDFLRFLELSAQEWQPGEIEKVEAALKSIHPRLARYGLNFPPEIYLVKTSGAEEGESAYTRGRAVILPPRKLGYADPRAFEKLLVHEFFHIHSRYNSDWREALYQAIGFTPCNEIELPGDLRLRKITNPDAPFVNHKIQVVFQNQAYEAAPVIYAKSDYDPRLGGSLFSYLVFQLLALEPIGERWAPACLGNEPLLLDLSQINGFYEQVGRNAGNITSPEEILAENFTRLVFGERDAPSPEILVRVSQVLSGF